MEVLGEKAFPEGHVDLLIKEAVRKGISRKVVLEVKAGAATRKNIEQIRYYMQVLGEECVGGVLIARSFSPRLRDVIGELEHLNSVSNSQTLQARSVKS